MSSIDSVNGQLPRSRPPPAYRNIADDPERVAALDHDLAALAARYDRGTGAIVMDWEYLLLTARRA